MAKKASQKEIEKEVKEVATQQTNPFPQSDFYTLEYIEKTWDLKVRYLRERIKDGSLAGKKVGVSYYVLHSDLLKFVESCNKE